MGGGVDGSGPKAKGPFFQLFEIVGHPSGHPRHREEDLAGIGRHPRGPRHGGQSEIDIGWRDGVFGGELEQRPDQLGILGAGHFVEEVEQDRAPRISVLVDGVAETGEQPLPPEGVVQGSLDPQPPDIDQQGVGQLAGTSVERAGDGLRSPRLQDRRPALALPP